MNYKNAYLHLFNEYTDLLTKLDAIVLDVRKAQVTAEMLCTSADDLPPIALRSGYSFD